MKKLKKGHKIVIGIITAILVLFLGINVFLAIRYPQVDLQLRMIGWISDLVMNCDDAESLTRFARTTINVSMPHDSAMDIEEIIIQNRDGQDLPLVIYKSKNVQKNATGLYWIHGGGYASGSARSCKKNVRDFVLETNTVVVAPDYTLSIEEPYPAAFNDVYDGLIYMKEHAQELGINSSQIFAGGESAGGGLVAALTLAMRDSGDVNIAFQMPIYPMINDKMDTDSMRGNTEMVWNEAKSIAGWQLYLGDLYGTDDVPEYAAAWRESDFSNLPPTYTFVGELDPFYDDTINYVNAINEAGGSAKADIYKGAYHGFYTFSSNVSLKAASKLLEEYQYAVENYFAGQ